MITDGAQPIADTPTDRSAYNEMTSNFGHLILIHESACCEKWRKQPICTCMFNHSTRVSECLAIGNLFPTLATSH